MYYQKVKIENIRNIKSIEIDFTVHNTVTEQHIKSSNMIPYASYQGENVGPAPIDEVAIRPITVIIGENGTAKTSILECLSLGILTARDLQNGNIGNYDPMHLVSELQNPFKAHQVPAPLPIASIYYTITDIYEGSEQSLQHAAKPYNKSIQYHPKQELRTRLSPTGERIQESFTDYDKNIYSNIGEIDYIAFAYGVYRTIFHRLNSPLAKLTNKDLTASLLQKSPLHIWNIIEQIELLGNASIYEDFSVKLSDFISSFLSDLIGVPKTEIRVHISKSRLCIGLLQDNYQLMDADRLSSGYASILLFLFDILATYTLFFSQWVDPSEINTVVLVDEIDTHLNPKWQPKILNLLTKYFPKVQWIVTTHSPIMLFGRKKSEIVRLKFENGSVVIDQNVEKLSDPDFLSMDEIISEYFEIDTGSAVHIWVEKYRNLFLKSQYNAQNQHEVPTEKELQEREELQSLRAKLISLNIKVEKLEKAWTVK